MLIILISATWDWVKCLTDVETHNIDTATFISSTCNFTKKQYWTHLTRLSHKAVLMTINYAAIFWASFNSDSREPISVGWSCNADEPWGRGNLLSCVICRRGPAQRSGSFERTGKQRLLLYSLVSDRLTCDCLGYLFSLGKQWCLMSFLLASGSSPAVQDMLKISMDFLENSGTFL